jgi:hypothetical protein
MDLFRISQHRSLFALDLKIKVGGKSQRTGLFEFDKATSAVDNKKHFGYTWNNA